MEHYVGWISSRFNGLNKYINPEYFRSKTLLELGCRYGDNGNKFHEYGAIVTSCDARKENLDITNRRFPHIKTFCIDLDNEDIEEHYDVILHWGTLYHLSEIETHLEKISNRCNVLLLESEVSDSDDKTFYISVQEHDAYDQSFNSKGIRPSQQYVEDVLSKNGFQFELIKDPILNSDFHVYDWEIKNTKTWRHGLRRFWICWKNTECPISSL
jgi:hypothetical protein